MPSSSWLFGYSLPKDAEEHLCSRGLHNALYTIKASDLKDDLFGTLVPCPFQEPASSRGETSNIDLPQKRPHEGAVGLLSTSSDPLGKLQKLDHVPSDTKTCILHFDGASKGNPGQAGAGAVLRTLSGTLICRIRQGLGIATCNAAEYRAIILGLKKALEMGYTSIQAQGDSKLVCMQLQGLWKVKHQTMSDLHAEAVKLKKQFSSFEISHMVKCRRFSLSFKLFNYEYILGTSVTGIPFLVLSFLSIAESIAAFEECEFAATELAQLDHRYCWLDDI
ncbi:hypothetical protein RDABS01_007462 [Bienertia sinuspersici]